MSTWPSHSQRRLRAKEINMAKKHPYSMWPAASGRPQNAELKELGLTRTQFRREQRKMVGKHKSGNARRLKVEAKEGYACREEADHEQSDRQSRSCSRSRSLDNESPRRHSSPGSSFPPEHRQSRSRSSNRSLGRRSPRTNRPPVSSLPPEHSRIKEVICVPYSLCGVGRIIGRGGVNMLRFQKQTKTKIDVSKGKDSYEVLISGSTLDSIERCKALVRGLMREIREERQCAQGGDSQEKTMSLSPLVVARIIGRGGARIKELQDESGAFIDVQNTANPPLITIQGSSSCVAKATKMISKIIGDSLPDEDGFGAMMTETLEVSLEEVRRIMGRNGESIMKLEEKSGSKIDVIKPTGDPTTLKLTGTSDAISCAIDLISILTDAMAPAAPKFPKPNPKNTSVHPNARPVFRPSQWSSLKQKGSSSSQAPPKPSSSAAPRPSQAPTMLNSDQSSDHEEDDLA